MEEKFTIQLFEGKQVRIVWDAEKEKNMSGTCHLTY